MMMRYYPRLPHEKAAGMAMSKSKNAESIEDRKEDPHSMRTSSGTKRALGLWVTLLSSAAGLVACATPNRAPAGQMEIAAVPLEENRAVDTALRACVPASR